MDEFLKILKQSTDAVDTELDRGLLYSENNYQNALIMFLKDFLGEDVAVNREVHINYRLSNGYIFGSGRADIICETKDSVYILELKANSDYKWLKKFSGQTERYVQHYESTKQIYGILILFGNCSPIIKVLP